MNNENWNMADRPEPWEQCHYCTGDTNPHKSNRGILAILLILVIFFSGVATAFNLMNIRLFQSFWEAAPATVSLRFSNTHPAADVSTAGIRSHLKLQDGQGYVSEGLWLGVAVQPLSSFDQLYYHLPTGLYVTEVFSDTDAAVKGLVPGDILLSLDGQGLTGTDVLQQLLYNYSAGDRVKLVIYRSGTQYTVEINLREAK